MTVDLRLTPDTAEAVQRLLDHAASLGMTTRIRSAYRTCAEQAEQYALGRTVPGTEITTHARGCQSWHVSGRAVDIDITSGPKDYAALGDFWKSLGGKWGGDFPGFPDTGHYEWHPGMTIEQACPDPSACVDLPPGSGALGGGVATSPLRKLAKGALVASLVVGAIAGGLAIGSKA